MCLIHIIFINTSASFGMQLPGSLAYGAQCIQTLLSLSCFDLREGLSSVASSSEQTLLITVMQVDEVQVM